MLILKDFNDLESFLDLLNRSNQTHELLYTQRSMTDPFGKKTDNLFIKIAILSSFETAYFAIKLHKDDLYNVNTLLANSNATKLSKIKIADNGSITLNF